MKFNYNVRVMSRNCFFSGFKGRVVDNRSVIDSSLINPVYEFEYEVEGRFGKDGRTERRWFKEKEMRFLWFGRW